MTREITLYGHSKWKAFKGFIKNLFKGKKGFIKLWIPLPIERSEEEN